MNFEFYNPTHLVFGAGTLSQLGEVVRKHGKKALIVTGGGSTMDASKVIAAATLYDGNPWNLIGHGQDNWVIPTRALPIITVPTLAATGSEMNKGAVN